MRRAALLFAVAGLTACDGVAFNTTVAANRAVRSQMAASVVPGRTTETGFITRWGRPVQKVREGGQVEYIYREVLTRAADGRIDPAGDSENYVIVTFQYGIATGVRTTETEVCRATFPPRPPGPAYATRTTVRPVGTCPGLYRPAVGDPVLPALAEGTASPRSSGDPSESDGVAGALPALAGIRGEDGVLYGEPIPSESWSFPGSKQGK